MPAVAVLVDTDPAECRRRNRTRDYGVPAGVLESQPRRMRAAVEEIGGPAQAEVTVLDVPVIGRDREDAASIVEKLRGRTTAAAFARRHHAGTADDHIGRYRLLADRGVRTVFVSLPDLTGPEDVLRLAPVAAAFAGGAW